MKSQILDLKSQNYISNGKTFIRFTICAVVLTFAFCALSLNTASAQQSRTVTIVPPNVQLTLDPGTTREGILKVINDSNETLTFNASVQDYIVVDKKGTPNLLPPNVLNARSSAASWLGVAPSTFTIEPHQKQELQYFLQVPPDARPGGHYAAISYTPANPEGETGNAAVFTKLGTLFYITVNGSINEYAKVTEFSANSFQEYGPVTLSTGIQNDGDLHIRPQGKITVTDMLGREIASVPLGEFNIFPGGARDYENSIGKELMIGQFKAKFIGSYGQNKNLPLVATLTFWVFPWRVTLVIILAIVALVLLWMLWKRRSRKIHTEKHPEKTTENPKAA